MNTTTIPDEDHPTGTAWRNSPRSAWTPEEQAEHLTAMTEAVSGWSVAEALRRNTPREQR
jgi:hypothetical protein